MEMEDLHPSNSVKWLDHALGLWDPATTCWKSLSFRRTDVFSYDMAHRESHQIAVCPSGIDVSSRMVPTDHPVIPPKRRVELRSFSTQIAVIGVTTGIVMGILNYTKF